MFDEPEGDHDPPQKGEYHDDHGQKSEFTLAVVVTIGPLEEATHVAHCSAQVVHGGDRVVDLSVGVPASRGHAAEVPALPGHMDGVSRDGQTRAQDRENDGHVPQREDPLQELSPLRHRDRRVRTRSEVSDCTKGGDQEDRHREAHRGLDEAGPEQKFAEGPSRSHGILPRCADGVAVPDRDKNIQGEQCENDERIHETSV